MRRVAIATLAALGKVETSFTLLSLAGEFTKFTEVTANLMSRVCICNHEEVRFVTSRGNANWVFCCSGRDGEPSERKFTVISGVWCVQCACACVRMRGGCKYNGATCEHDMKLCRTYSAFVHRGELSYHSV